MSDETTPSMRDLAAAYALGALDAEETARFERALADDPSLADEVAAYTEVAGLMGSAATGATPPAQLRARVVASAGTAASGTATDTGTDAGTVRSLADARRRAPEAPTAPARPGLVWWGALAAAVALLAATSLQLRRTATDLEAARTALAERGRRADSLAQRLAAREATLNAILEPAVQLVKLTPGGVDGGVIQLFVDRDRGRVLLHAFRLPPVPAGSRYQLWFVRPGAAPVPSVTFQTEATGHGMVEQIALPPGEFPAVAAITIEPEAGSAAPTTPILLSGAFGR